MNYNEEEIKDIVFEVLAENFYKDKEDILLSDKLENDLGIDSLDAVEILISIEEEFNIEIEDKEAKECTDVASIVRLIQTKLNEKGLYLPQRVCIIERKYEDPPLTEERISNLEKALVLTTRALYNLSHYVHYNTEYPNPVTDLDKYVYKNFYKEAEDYEV